MASKGVHIDFMFLGPPYPAAGSDADQPVYSVSVIEYVLLKYDNTSHAKHQINQTK